MVRVTPKDFAPPSVIDRMRSRSLVIGVVFSVAGAWINARVQPSGICSCVHGCSHSCSGLGLTTGSLVLLMLQYTSGGNWGRLGRRIWEAGASNWWLMGLFWLPIAFGVKRLYPWARVPQDSAKLAEFTAHYGADKLHYYLNVTFFSFRGVLYFLAGESFTFCLSAGLSAKKQGPPLRRSSSLSRT